MAERPQNLRQAFDQAEEQRRRIEAALETTSSTFQENLSSVVLAYEGCLKAVNRISLFSPNETLEDVSTGDSQYLRINYCLGELVLKLTSGERKSNLQRAQDCFERFLKLLDSYDMLSTDDARMLEKFLDARMQFSIASTADAAVRRELKISRFREEKELKKKLESDEAAVRNLQLTQTTLCVHQTFAALESIAQELQILALAPTTAPTQANSTTDPRERGANGSTAYSDRLDSPLSQLSAGLRGPILDKDGRPLRPFTLLDNRQHLQQGVFRPDHSLPTMTIGEYLDEERKRGGIIDGGGPQSAVQPEPDEDDIDKADEETLKKRAWDEFVEANPKGSGNTINRG